MSIRRGHINRTDRFTIIANDWARDERLSFKARGVLVYLLSHSEGWTLTLNTLVDKGREGREAIAGAVHELEDLGYLRRERVRDEATGQLKGTDYVTTDPAETVSLGTGNPTYGFPAAGKPAAGKPPTKKNMSLEDQVSEEHVAQGPAPRTRRRKTRRLENWAPNPKHREEATQLGLDVAFEAEQFKAWTDAKDYLFADWDAGFRNHLLNTSKRNTTVPGRNVTQVRGNSGGGVAEYARQQRPL